MNTISPHETAARPELWGGVECSVVRVGDGWRDQTIETGHHMRPTDLDLIAGAGIRTLRYPLLWERVSPDHPDCSDWSWHDERLARLRRLGVTPVAGLTHHGSGPRYTNLLDRGFAEGLAAHAGRAASRYPWIEAWTPVNEPMTTARFSGLYGHWFPFHRDEASCLRMVVNQCRATLLAMRAVRCCVPHARLIQTEDFGRVFATRRLADQAAHENERRWLSLDLLTGLVDRHHPWWPKLLAVGVVEDDLLDLMSGDAMPDVIGVNYYVTSDRFLDHRTALYPPHLRGGNGRTEYADTEATRMDLPADAIGWLARLREVWARYRQPIALTEVHLGDAPEEQVRWLMEAWNAAVAARVEGMDISAVTVWALLGSVDWDSMLRHRRDRYEAGPWDARHDPPRPTFLAEAVSALARGQEFTHPALGILGWWRQDDRFHAAARRA